MRPPSKGGLREVHEETGYRVQPGRPLGEVRYLKKSGGGAREKVVNYWAMRAIGGEFSPSPEVDEMRWLPLDEAREQVTRALDREVLERFSRRPPLTGSVLLVRHGTAGSRSKWEGDDALRPLDDEGQEQAEEMVRLLSRFGVEEIISADYVRCVQTVRPLSEAAGRAGEGGAAPIGTRVPGPRGPCRRAGPQPRPSGRSRGRVQPGPA